MEGNAEWIVGSDVRGEPVNTALFFRLKCAEQAIPDDQYARMVAIDVLRIRPVMHSMMRRSIQDLLQNTHMTNYFSVDPELV